MGGWVSGGGGGLKFFKYNNLVFLLFFRGEGGVTRDEYIRTLINIHIFHIRKSSAKIEIRVFFAFFKSALGKWFKSKVHIRVMSIFALLLIYMKKSRMKRKMTKMRHMYQV